MPKQSDSSKKTSLSPSEQYELNQWLEEHDVNPANLRRSFTDVLPLARILNRYYPEIIDLNYYPPKNSVYNKLSNWETFNKRVLSKLGVPLTREQMVGVARSVPGSVDMLLYSVMKMQVAAERKARLEQANEEDEEEAQDDKMDDDEAKAKDKSANVAQGKKLAELAKPESKSLAQLRPPNVVDVVEVAEVAEEAEVAESKDVPHAAAEQGSTDTTPKRRLRRNRQRLTQEEAIAATIAGASRTRGRGELVHELRKQTILYSIFMQVVKQLQRKDAKIGG